MEKINVAHFDSAHGPKQIDEVVEYRADREGRPIVEFKATDGKTYLAHRENLIIKEAVRIPVASIA